MCGQEYGFYDLFIQKAVPKAVLSFSPDVETMQLIF
jgi:hypothetical protein